MNCLHNLLGDQSPGWHRAEESAIKDRWAKGLGETHHLREKNMAYKCYNPEN